MLNDPLVYDLARQWAKRVLSDLADGRRDDALNECTRSALCRLPTETELAARPKILSSGKASCLVFRPPIAIDDLTIVVGFGSCAIQS